MTMEDSNKLPKWILYWFYATAAICTWDASFIMCRPHSLPGGSLAYIWYLYKYYVVIDLRYPDISDVYVYAQSLLNYVEVLLNIVTIIMHYKSSRNTLVMAFTVTVMTFWKTVLYFMMFMSFTGGRDRIGATSLPQEILLFHIPNGFWIVIPFLVMVRLWPTLTNNSSEEVTTTVKSTRRTHKKNA